MNDLSVYGRGELEERIVAQRAAIEQLRSALQSLEQAYSNKHSPQHRAACLNEARTALADKPEAVLRHQSCTQPCPDCGRQPPGPHCGKVVQRITNVDGLRIDTETLPACLQRTDADYAMQHAGYLATAATEFMDACNAFEEAREKHEDAEPGAEAAAAYDVMFAAQEAHSEAWSGLRTAVYEFEKRRDRALRHQVSNDRSVVLSGAMLKAALEFVAPDGTPDQMEAEVMIQITEARTSVDGDAMPAGYYCWLAEYPEEGCVPLFETVAGKKSPARVNCGKCDHPMGCETECRIKAASDSQSAIGRES